MSEIVHQPIHHFLREEIIMNEAKKDATNTANRKIIHIDMDAFFASVEQRDFPELRGKPVAVGGGGLRGVVAAASYEARAYGVRSAMPGAIAARKCPGLIFVKSRFDAYKEVSKQIRSIFLDYTDLVEPLSLDEAYLDVTHNKKGVHSATLIAEEIRARIFAETQLTASAGVSVNKFLAKVASDVNKPNGLTLIAPKDVEAFIDQLPIERFHGIGKVTSEKLKRRNIHFGKDLKALELNVLNQLFGKSGSYFYNICRGIDDREVKPNRIPKSISCEETYAQNLSDSQAFHEAIKRLAERLMERISKQRTKQNHSVEGKSITLKIKYADFSQETRSKTFNSFIKPEDFASIGIELYEQALKNDEVRLLGLGISKLNYEDDSSEAAQLTFEF